MLCPLMNNRADSKMMQLISDRMVLGTALNSGHVMSNDKKNFRAFVWVSEKIVKVNSESGASKGSEKCMLPRAQMIFFILRALREDSKRLISETSG